MNGDIIAPAELLAAHVRPYYQDAGPCHDWSHACRVAALAARLATAEGLSARLAHAGGLLHDCGRATDEADHERRSAEIATVVLSVLQWSLGDQRKVLAAITAHRWSKHSDPESQELLGTSDGHDGSGISVAAIVADADRLDALGLIGVTRAYLWLGEHGWSREDPEDWPGRNGAALRAHWTEKLRLLASSMHTETARLIASKREAAMLAFIDALTDETNPLAPLPTPDKGTP